jgi:deoxyribodipyrimidine photo-lyase
MILRLKKMDRKFPHFASVLVWFRRDLRLDDHTALSQALLHSDKVYGCFVFDQEILAGLPSNDRRVSFIHASVCALDQQWRERAALADASLLVRHGIAVTNVVTLAKQLGVQAVFTHHDDEPQSLARDAQVLGELANQGIAFHSFKDHVVLERSEVMTQNGTAYSVFTPYKNAWLKKITPTDMAERKTTPKPGQLAVVPAALRQPLPDLKSMGFETVDLSALHIHAGSEAALALVKDFAKRIKLYEETRNFPSVKGPSYLSVHLRFGTVSIRQLARLAYPLAIQGDAGAQTWLSELIWRDFYHQIMFHHPHAMKRSFKHEYDAIEWEKGKTAKALFEAWCEGRTGYPLVDAAMAQINQTGYMHNRLRMVVASFLVKDLGIDWRWGEQYFALHLNDFDLAANNGGWQWASSSGCDAQPYFRIFNPINQSEKFDPQGKFIKRYLPQLAALSDKDIHAPWLAKPVDLKVAGVELDKNYPLPLVDHAKARAKTLLRYSVVAKKKPV